MASIFHSTVSRRDFMKFMGVAGVGVGTAALTAPVFHDLDELTSSSSGVMKRPWFVKERAFYDPTTEVDWSVLKRRVTTDTGQDAATRAKYYPAREAASGALNTSATNEHIAAGDPGWTYRWQALKATVTRGWPGYVSQTWAGFDTSTSWKGTAYTGVKTPTQRGEPKWSGTPEEATNMLAAYMRYTGAAISGFGDFSPSSRERSQVVSTYVKNHSPLQIVFEDIDRAYQTTTKRVIPNKFKSYFVNFEQMTPEFARMAPAVYLNGTYTDPVAVTLKPSTMLFLQYIGDYQMVGGGGDDGTPFVEGASANLTGVAEGSRNELYCLTPEYGCCGRLHNYVTDFPLAPTKPIDAGMFRFCHSCHKCANACPPGAINQDAAPSWDLPTINGVPCNFHNTGTKEFWLDAVLCDIYQTEAPVCKQCWGNCTFTTNHGAMAHQLVRGIVSNASVFNTFFYKMGEAFGYGSDPNKAEQWWDESYPVLGIDTSWVAYSGAYKK